MGVGIGRLRSNTPPQLCRYTGGEMEAQNSEMLTAHFLRWQSQVSCHERTRRAAEVPAFRVPAFSVLKAWSEKSSRRSPLPDRPPGGAGHRNISGSSRDPALKVNPVSRASGSHRTL